MAVVSDIAPLHPATRRDESLDAQGIERTHGPLPVCQHAGEVVREVSVARHLPGVFRCPDGVRHEPIIGAKVVPKKF